MTINLLADFYASRTPGLLEDIEEVVAIAESARSVEDAAERVRPADEAHAVTLAAAMRWLRRRVRAIHSVLATMLAPTIVNSQADLQRIFECKKDQARLARDRAKS